MLQETIHPQWLSLFASVVRRCGIAGNEQVVVLCESASRPVLVQLCELAAAQCAATVFTLRLPSPVEHHAPVQRSTGACMALAGQSAAIAALAQATLVLDCTVEGLMHAPELPQVLGSGARVLYVSNEHPEALARLVPDDALEATVKTHTKRLRSAKTMHVTSAAGTDLQVNLAGAAVGGNWGYTTKPGTLSHWPGGLVLGFPAAGAVSGQLVLNVGDVNLTFKRYIESPVTLTIEDDHITHIAGTGVDAELMRSNLAAWAEHADDRAAYAVSHVGYGLNPHARWDSMALYDKRDFNGTELRAFAGNFLYSTGANEVAGRHTRGHFDLPMRNCTVALDGEIVVREGVLL